MFRRLHLQMTLFCTMVTGCIFLLLTCICLFFAEDNLKSNGYTSFLRQLNSALIHLQEQDSISHQWLNQIQKDGQFLLYLYDNNKPLYYQNYHESKEENRLKEEALHTACTEYDMDIFSANINQIIVHTEFNFTSSDSQDYYASAGTIPKGKKHLGFLILFPLQKQQKQIRQFRLIIAVTDLTAVLLLFIFSWFFTRRMIIPLKNSRQKQMDFIASASHELRAPLSVVHTGLEVLKKTDNPNEQAHFIDLMTQENNRMQRLICDMLLLANADSAHLPMHPKNCQPDGILIGIYEKYESLAKKKQIDLSIKLPKEMLPDCSCDKERMTQVFSILLDNALSYTPSGGKVCLLLTFQKNFLLFSVSDTGCGVNDKEKELIFDRFYRSDHAHTDKMHFGLGLCIAKEIVTAHHGRIWVEDSAEGGSCFFVRLPVT